MRILSDQRVTIPQVLEDLATVSVGYFYRCLIHLIVGDPTSSDLVDIRQRYHEVFLIGTNFMDLPLSHTMTMIHALITWDWGNYEIWRDYRRPPDHDHTEYARDLAEVVLAEYQRERKAPKWILRFAFYSLSLDPLPLASTTADCLKIIAIDLDCDVSNIAALKEKYLCSSLIGIHLLTKK